MQKLLFFKKYSATLLRIETAR